MKQVRIVSVYELTVCELIVCVNESILLSYLINVYKIQLSYC